jgi:hypothetical protein
LGRARRLKTCSRRWESIPEVTSPPRSVDIPVKKYAEVHCVAICFDPEGYFLAAKRPTTKRGIQERTNSVVANFH